MDGARSRLLLLLAAALAVAAVAGWCGLRQVDDGFVRTHHALDLDHPERWATDPAAVAPGTLGRLLWPGVRPLDARFGPVAAGDLLKLKVRAERPGVQVRLLLDGHEVVTGPAPVDWTQVELLLPRGGQTLRLEQLERPPSPIHVSRVSATNVRGFVEGPVTLYLPSAGTAVTGAERGAVPWPALVVLPVLLVALVAWRCFGAAGDLARSVQAAVLEVLPGVALLGLAEVVLLAAGGRLVYPTRTFLVVVAGPPLVIEAIRHRRRLGRALAALGRGCGALVDRAFARGEATAARLGLDRVTASAAEAGEGLTTRQLRPAGFAFLALVAVLATVFTSVVVQELGGPLYGKGDIGLWSSQGRYVARNLSFTPLPRLDLVNDQLFYPYGGSNVFQPWVLEMHLFTAAAERLFGAGPWVQLYYLLSVVGVACGAFLLLVGDHGVYRAAVAALAVSFCSYYAISKYPVHAGVACVTWMTLSLLADWVMVRRYVVGRPWSARLLAARALLLILVLGQDLSYLAGIALTSFALCALWITILACARATGSPRALIVNLRQGLAAVRESVARHLGQVAILTGLTAAAAFVYLPLVLQIGAAANRFDFSGVAMGAWWANPLRLLIPVLPGANPRILSPMFHDSAESLFDSVPGAAFVLAALAGVVFGRRLWRAWVPFLALLALLLSFHPSQFDLLRHLPWFAFARVSGRFTVAYPALLTILALAMPAGVCRGRRGVVLAALACCLLATEAVTAYRLDLARPRRLYRADTEFQGLMQEVREAPGEAVLDWPFCVAGGNGVGGRYLGRYYGLQAGIFTLHQFHNKKVVAAYFGRLHPDQIQPYLDAGWPHMFFPDNPSGFSATRQRRDFVPREWDFFKRFFVLNDFCGILLYTDLLPEQTVEGFHRRFGQPAAAADHTPFGRLEFILKRPDWSGLVDPEAGRALVLPHQPPPRPIARLDFADPEAGKYLLRGWGGREKRYRSTEGHLAELGFSVERVETMLLTFRATTFQRQRLLVLLNGTLLEEQEYDGRGFVVHSVVLPAERLRPTNVLRFELPDAHSPKSVGVNNDRRVLGLTLDWLELEALGEAVAEPGPAT